MDEYKNYIINELKEDEFSTCFQRLRSCNADGMPLAPYMILNYMRIAKVKLSSSNISYYFTQYQKTNAQQLYM